MDSSVTKVTDYSFDNNGSNLGNNRLDERERESSLRNVSNKKRQMHIVLKVNNFADSLICHHCYQTSSGNHTTFYIIGC
jgi:hypothetical protein